MQNNTPYQEDNFENSTKKSKDVVSEQSSGASSKQRFLDTSKNQLGPTLNFAGLGVNLFGNKFNKNFTSSKSAGDYNFDTKANPLQQQMRNKQKTPLQQKNPIGRRPIIKDKVVSITYEEIGLFPRSFSRVIDRFLKQIFSDVENLVIQEYRFYRYLFLTTIQTIFVLLFVPLFVNFIAKNYLIRPVTEYFWNTKQTEIFLNSYEQKRAFLELQDFEEKLYFESLLTSNNSINNLHTADVGVESATNLQNIQESSISGSLLSLNTYLPERQIQSNANKLLWQNSNISNNTENKKLNSCDPLQTMGGNSPEMSEQNKCASSKQRFLDTSKNQLAPTLKDNLVNNTQPNLQTSVLLDDQHRKNLTKIENNALSNSSSAKNIATTNFFFKEPLLTNVDVSSLELTPLKSESLSGSFAVGKIPKLNVNDTNISVQNSYNQSLPTAKFEILNIQSNLLQERLQEKTVELAIRYNNHSIESITNFFADFLSLLTLLYLLVSLEIQINITKSFLLEVFFGLDDSKKSLLILIMTDLLVGYHSSNLWELFFQFLFNHYGIPESQTGIFLLVATLPVLLDVLFKYLIFRHLNRASPATVATYHAIIE